MRGEKSWGVSHILLLSLGFSARSLPVIRDQPDYMYPLVRKETWEQALPVWVGQCPFTRRSVLVQVVFNLSKELFLPMCKPLVLAFALDEPKSLGLGAENQQVRRLGVRF